MQSRSSTVDKPWYFSFWRSLERTTLEDHLRYTLRAIVLTRTGERRARPELGCSAADFLYRPLAPSLSADLTRAIEEAIAAQEPRVEVTAVHIAPRAPHGTDATRLGKIWVQVSYLVKETQRTDQLKLEL